MRVAHFIQRYPPALGGSEAYFARLSRYLASRGDEVTVFTTTGDALDSFWDRRAAQLPAGDEVRDGVRVVRCPLWHFPVGHRYLLKAASLIPLRRWQALTVPFNPVAPAMWRAAGDFDVVHAGSFPYSFPLECARQLARRLGVPFLLTPFVHTGDPADRADRVRRAYTTPALLRLADSAERVFVQTEGERDAPPTGVDPRRLVARVGVDLAGCTGGDRPGTRSRYKVGTPPMDTWRTRASRRAISSICCWRPRRRGPAWPLQRRAGWRGDAELPVVLGGCSVRRPGPPRSAGRAGECDFSRRPRRVLLAEPVGIFVRWCCCRGVANGVPCVGYRAGGVAWVIRDGIDGLLVRWRRDRAGLRR
ncbi:MAG: glycosyltransferase [Gemmataceae bacterium]